MASHSDQHYQASQVSLQPSSGPNPFLSTATQDLELHMVNHPAAPAPIQTGTPVISGGTNPFVAPTSTPSPQMPVGARSETPVSPGLASNNPFLAPSTPVAATAGSNNPFLSPPRAGPAAANGSIQQAPTPASVSRPRTPVLAPGEGEWRLKEISWPDPRVGGMRRKVKILMQNVNGPCSLLALSNVLILRGSIHLPEHLDRISYSELSQLLADFFVSRPSTPSPGKAPLNLSAALDILPTTVQGLTINVGFDSISSFEATPAHTASGPNGAGHSEQAAKSDLAGGELALFEHAGVDLVHGWLADESDPELWGALQRAVQFGGGVPANPSAPRGKMTYDRVQEAIVRGLEVELRSGASLSAAGKGPQLSREDQQGLEDGRILQRFLQETASQLTYPGLFALLELPPGSVVAFFRNSHLGVLYRRPSPSAEEASSAGDSEPLLFQLITDTSFLRDPQYCWEALSDVDGSAARFYDDYFAAAAAGAGGDWSGVSAERVVAEQERQERELQQLERARNMAGGANLADYLDEEDRDLQIARALQEEQDRELAEQHQAAEDRHNRRANTRLPGGVAARASAQNGDEPRPFSTGRKSKFGRGSGEGSGKDKKCVIM